MSDITTQVDAYKRWIEQEGIPVIRDWYIEDLRTVPLSPWERTGGLGAYIDLVGSADRQGAYICEIPPGGNPRSISLRNLFTLFPAKELPPSGMRVAQSRTSPGRQAVFFHRP